METFKADWLKPRYRPKDAAMKKLLLLSVLILAPAFDGESLRFQTKRSAAGVSREEPDARPEHAYGIEHQIKAPPKSIMATKRDCLPPTVRLTRSKRKD